MNIQSKRVCGVEFEEFDGGARIELALIDIVPIPLKIIASVCLMLYSLRKHLTVIYAVS